MMALISYFRQATKPRFLGIVFFSVLLSGCAGNFTIADVNELIYSKDGKSLFMTIEFRNAVDNYKYGLYRTDLKAKHRVKIADGNFANLALSPSGAYLAANNLSSGREKAASALPVFDAKSLRAVRTISEGPVLRAFWFPLSDKLVYATPQGVFRHDMKTDQSDLLLKGLYIPLAVSPDERRLLYTTGASALARNALHMLDFESGKNTRLTVMNGAIDAGAFDENSRVYFDLHKKDGAHELLALAINSRLTNIVRKSKRAFGNIQYIRPKISMLMTISDGLDSQGRGIGFQDAFFLSTDNHKVTPVLSRVFRWAYNADKNKVIWVKEADTSIALEEKRI